MHTDKKSVSATFADINAPYDKCKNKISLLQNYIKKLSMLNSAEHEIFSAYKSKITNNCKLLPANYK